MSSHDIRVDNVDGKSCGRARAGATRRAGGAGGPGPAGGPPAGGVSWPPPCGFGMIEPMFASACVTSLGMIQTLFDSPWAICGSVWRYW